MADLKNFAVKKRATVPEVYRKAAKILKQAEERKDSVKNLIYSSGFRVSRFNSYKVANSNTFTV